MIDAPTPLRIALGRHYAPILDRVTLCYVRFGCSLGQRVQPATMIGFKQIEFFDHTRSSASAIFRNSSFLHVAICRYSLLRAQQRLDGAALVHRAVAFRDLVERQRQIEDLAGIDFPLPHEINQFWQEAAHGGWATVKVGERIEQPLAADLHPLPTPTLT